VLYRDRIRELREVSLKDGEQKKSVALPYSDFAELEPTLARRQLSAGNAPIGEQNSPTQTTNAPTTPTTSYYDYLKTELPEGLKELYNDEIIAIDNANAQAIAKINAMKDSAIVDADTSYKSNLSNYGAKNEALRKIGLSGSGYSEYLDSQAYATYRNEVQNAKSSALEAETKVNSEAENEKTKLAKEYLAKKQTIYDDIANNITADTSDEEIQYFLDSGQIDPKSKDQLVQLRNTQIVSNINNLVNTGDTDSATKNADKYYDNGNGWMDQKTYQKVYADSWLKDLDGATITESNISDVLNQLDMDKDSDKISNTDYEKLKKTAWGKVGTAYTPSQAGISDKKEEKGKNTKFKMGGTYYKCSTNMWYNPELDGILNGISTGDKGTKPEENTIVKYNGKTYAYMKHYVSQNAMGAGQFTGFYTSWIEVTKE
jgi:vacuolar-type H+-ATPase subunit H